MHVNCLRRKTSFLINPNLPAICLLVDTLTNLLKDGRIPDPLAIAGTPLSSKRQNRIDFFRLFGYNRTSLKRR